MNRYLEACVNCPHGVAHLSRMRDAAINPPIAHADPKTGYRYGTREFKDKDTLVVLAFSGGGTRAAAFPMVSSSN